MTSLTPTAGSHRHRRGAAMMAVLMFTFVGGIGITGWIYLTSARLQQAELFSIATQRHTSWGNSRGISHQYAMAWAYRNDVTRGASTTSLNGWGGTDADGFTNLRAFQSTDDYTSTASGTSVYPFNNLRPWPTTDGSVYFSRTSGDWNVTQTEHTFFYSYLKTYQRAFLGDLLFVHKKPGAAVAAVTLCNNLTVNGRVIIYDSGAVTSGIRANECLNLSKTGASTTLNSSGSALLMPQNFAASPLFTSGAGGPDGGAVTDGSLNMADNSSFAPGSLLAKATATGGITTYTGQNPQGNSSSAIEVLMQNPGSETYPPPPTGSGGSYVPYGYAYNGKFNVIIVRLRVSTLGHIRIKGNYDQVVIEGQTNAADYNNAATYNPVIVWVDRPGNAGEVHDIRFLNENSRPFILAVGQSAGTTQYWGFSGNSSAAGGGPLRWRLHVVNEYGDIWLAPPSGNNVSFLGSIRTNWHIHCTDTTTTQRFTLTQEPNQSQLVNFLPRDGWLEPYFLIQ